MEKHRTLNSEERSKPAPRIKDFGTRCTKMRRNFELFEEARRVFKIPALRTKWVRLLSSARLFWLHLFLAMQKRWNLIKTKCYA